MESSVLLTTLNAKYIHMNLAIRLLYDLNSTDSRLHWKEFTIKDDFDSIAFYCASFEVVCFSCYIWNIHQTLEVCEKIKKSNPEIKILLGGPEVSYEWEEIIVLDYVDYIITGEGEIPFTAFLHQYPNVTSIPNLISKTENSIQYQKENVSFPLTNYSNRNPYRHDDPQTLFNRVLYLETSRGCPYKCEFCLASLDNKVRYLPMPDIKSNLLYLMTHGKVIKFLDRTFNVKKDFTLDIFNFILENARPENVFQFEITADILHPDIIQFILEKVPKGMFRFEIGIQTVNQKANLEVSRKQSFEKTKGVINQLKHVVEMHLDLIVGLPLDYWDDIKYSFEEVFKLYPPELQLGFLKFLKGTPLREKHNQHGYTFDPKAPYQIIQSNYLSAEELNEIVKLEHGLEIYWNKKRLVHTLTYITFAHGVFDFLLGLGRYFGENSSYFKYTLKDIYQIAYGFIQSNYAYDANIMELFIIDYYLQHKIKPSDLFGWVLEKKEKIRIAAFLKLPNLARRYVMLPLHFNYNTFIQEQRMEAANDIMIIEFTGIALPTFHIVKAEQFVELTP